MKTRPLMEINRKLCLEVLDWCKTKYGMSKFKDEYPKLYFRSKSKFSKQLGYLKGEYYYDDNEIFIYAEAHLFEDDPTLDVINTIIHEYKHFLQDMDKYRMYHEKYYYSYQNHPYEKTCNKFAMKEQYECYYHIQKKFKKQRKVS